MIAIIDYGMGNIHSVKKALESCGADTCVTNDPADLKKAEKIVFPGVGAFGDAVRELKRRGLAEALRREVKNKKTFLGICLGMQVLFEASRESPKVKGLGLIKGRVKKLTATKSRKVPHMGWNQLKIGVRVKGQGLSDCPLLKGVSNGAYVYFCHSYYPCPEDKKVAAAFCSYGLDFPAVVWQDNIYGVQFHPEKSQGVGLRMIENFVKLC